MKKLKINIEYRDQSWEKIVDYDPKTEDVLEVIEEEQEGWSDMMLEENPNFNYDEWDEFYETYHISYSEL